MSVTAWLLVVLTLATVALIVLALVGEHYAADEYAPQHGEWTMVEKTRRIDWRPERRPATEMLIPDPGESEWRFPPAP